MQYGPIPAAASAAIFVVVQVSSKKSTGITLRGIGDIATVYEQNADGNDADEHEANDDHHNSTIIDFLLSNAYFIFIHSSNFSNTS